MKRRRLLSGLIVLLFLASAYASAVMLSRVDGIFLPANQVSSLSFQVPGTDRQVSVPGLEGDADADRRINFLVLGLDRRPEEGPEAPGRSDSMYVVGVDLDTRRARVLGIPRDLWVEVPLSDGRTWGPGRINEAYVYGELAGAGKGAEYAVAAVERNLGIPIDHWVIIDWEGFREVVDLLGGVDLVVEEELADPEHPDVLAAFPGGVVRPGLQHMTGAQALGYARTRRSALGDLDRIRRQQQLMRAVVSKAARIRAPDDALDLWRRHGSAVLTDLSPFQVPGLALLAEEVTADDLQMYSLGDAAYFWTTPAGARVVRVDEDAKARIIGAFLGVPAATDPLSVGS